MNDVTRPSKERDAFEAWAKDRHWPLLRNPYRQDYYQSDSTQFGWWAWQAARAENEPPAVQEINSLSSMTILRICTAYESGYGRGQSTRELAQPYAAGCPEAIAYYEGWVSGVRRAAQPPAPEYKIGDRVSHDGHITEVVGLSVKYMLCGGAVVYGHDLQPASRPTKLPEQQS